MMRETRTAGAAVSEVERHIIRLDGCRPIPLGAYLKALGVLRLVSEQSDPDATGWWEDEGFMLDTSLTKDGLREFFLEHYRPTPFVGPWGARSGFFQGSSERAAREALTRIEGADEPRLDQFADVVREVREILGGLGFHEKAKDEDKLEVLRACRARLPDHILRWLDACYVLTESGSKYPPLLGTGGNEGSGSYASGFAQMLVQCIVERTFDAGLTTALFDSQAPGTSSDQTPGQFSPGAAGGPNASTGFEGRTRFNPWDYVLCLEGTLLFSATATRQHREWARPEASFPFTVRPTGSGSGKTALADEADGRAEMWTPLWDRPTTATELAVLFGEGRATLGARAATDGLGFSRAVANLGVDRGISAFERHGMLKRFGKSILAIPLGRVRVERNPPADLINDLDRAGWLSRFRGLGRAGDHQPARLASLVRRLEDALFALTRRSDQTAASVQEILVVLGEAQRYLATSP